MSALQVVVRSVRAREPNPALAPLYGLFDVVVDGVNITARIGDAQAVALLGELALVVAELAQATRERATLQLYTDGEAWELGLEEDDGDVLISVFRSGPTPEVAVHERRVTLSALRDGTIGAIHDALAGKLPKRTAAPLGEALAALEAAWPRTPRRQGTRRTVRLSPDAIDGIAFEATGDFRQTDGGTSPAGDSQVERADLHALLVRGQIVVHGRGRAAKIGTAPIFLFAERLLMLADDALDAWRLERPIFRRFDVGSARIGIRRGVGDKPLVLSVERGEAGENRDRLSFPEIDASSLVRAAVAFARDLARTFIELEPGQENNLRLVAMRDAADVLDIQLRDSVEDDSCTNPIPDSYRHFPLVHAAKQMRGPWSHGAKMRFLPKWVATVPGIDLRSTFLCGERLVVGSNREMACLERTTGEVLWRLQTTRAASVVTPAALVRLHPDGTVALHDLETGETRRTTRTTPRHAGGATGAVVHAPGLPKLLILQEGDRQITAIDLVSGDVRWRHTVKRPGGYRMRRAGKLVLIAGGDNALVALDVASGEVVWRARTRLPFSGDITVDHDALFVLSGAPTSRWQLHRFDPWTGAEIWSSSVDDRPAPARSPLVTSDVVVAATRDSSGSGAQGFDRATGEQLWEQAPGLASPTTAWLAVDDGLVANSDAGTLICLEAATGRLRYNHVFARHVDADQPRRLEPVLRSGALFVPQHQVHVVRPGDGEVIGSVPTDLIPDLIRVDERCNVYVAEESGHLAAFGVAPRLVAVK